MPLTVHLLGTGASYNLGRRLTTMLAVEAGDDVLLVDCGSNAGRALTAAGLPLDRLRALILTHEHLDHTASFPLFMQQLWLSGRSRPLPVYGPAPALDFARRLFAQNDSSTWEGMFEISYHPVTLTAGTPVVTEGNIDITTAPTRHSVPGIGLRLVGPEGGILAYSSDTEPAPEIIELAHSANLLIHEATGDYSGHSSGADAGRVAGEAGAKQLVLVHLAGDAEAAAQVAAEAGKYFAGAVFAGEDGAVYRVE